MNGWSLFKGILVLITVHTGSFESVREDVHMNK